MAFDFDFIPYDATVTYDIDLHDFKTLGDFANNLKSVHLVHPNRKRLVIKCNAPFPKSKDMSVPEVFRLTRAFCENLNWEVTVVFAVKSVELTRLRCLVFFPDGRKETLVLESGNLRIEWFIGDITEEKTDAIVNASNPSLKLGGGVSGAIKRKAHSDLQTIMFDRLKSLNSSGIDFKDGDSVLTDSCGLSSRYIIHTASVEGSPTTIKRCLTTLLNIAEENQLVSLSLPALGTGTGGLDLLSFTDAFFSVIEHELNHLKHLKKIRMILYSGDEFYQVKSHIMAKADLMARWSHKP